MTVGGNTHVFCTIIGGLYPPGGAYRCINIVCFLSYNFAMFFYNVLLANKLSRVCILQNKYSCVLLHPMESVASHNYVQVHIWRRDLVFVCRGACEHYGRWRYQVAARPWSAEIQGLGFADSAQGLIVEVASCSETCH